MQSERDYMKEGEEEKIPASEYQAILDAITAALTSAYVPCSEHDPEVEFYTTAMVRERFSMIFPTYELTDGVFANVLRGAGFKMTCLSGMSFYWTMKELVQLRLPMKEESHEE